MKSESDKICSIESCNNEALSWSEPSLCAHHIDDLDNWYSGVRERLETSGLDEDSRLVEGIFVHSEYLSAISANPIAHELYEHFERRAEPPKAYAFSEEHFVTALAHFYITAAASGILGNFSYDALKMCVLQVLGLFHKEARPNDDSFEEIVEREKYEETRKRFHLKMPFLEIDKDTEKKVKTKYHNLVQEGFEKKPELLFRPKRKSKK